MADQELKIDETLRLTSDENGFLQLVAEFADTKDPKAREELSKFLQDTNLERVRRIGSAIVGTPMADLREDERKFAERFKKMVIDYRKNIQIFNAMGQESVLIK
jgi:hypothetical protein